jgi:S-adenosylmethionine synthetase
MELIENVINKVASEYIDENTKILVNTAGRFVIGGPMADIGISGNKMEMYTYGLEVRTGDNTFSGKDQYKIDRTGSLMARKIAKYVVEQGMADKCQIGVSYSIGLADPVLITVDTFGTLHWDEEGILDIVQEQFSLSPMDIVSELKLLKPIYKDLSLNGHFGRPDSNWEILETDVISL